MISHDSNQGVGAEIQTKMKLQLSSSLKSLSKEMEHRLLPAVSSRNDPLVIDEGATTIVVADVDWNLPGLRVLPTLVPSNNFVIHRGCSCKDISYLPQTCILFILSTTVDMFFTCSSKEHEGNQADHLVATRVFLQPEWTCAGVHSLHLYSPFTLQAHTSPVWPTHLQCAHSPHCCCRKQPYLPSASFLSANMTSFLKLQFCVNITYNYLYILPSKLHNCDMVAQDYAQMYSINNFKERTWS